MESFSLRLLGPFLVWLFPLLAHAACSAEPQAQSGAATEPNARLVLSLGAYTTPREAYGVILPAFVENQKGLGREVTFQESYLGSGAQARAIIAGFEADVAALSLEPDIDSLAKAGLIKEPWKHGKHAGIVTRSIVVIGVRAGNPKQIRDWDDLEKPGVRVLTPNVRTSGGARWNIAAIWGAAMRGHTQDKKPGDSGSATRLLTGILRNVRNMDAGARESLLNFERGVGDAIITYENEILVGKQKGQSYEYVIPKSTIRIENPVAIVDGYVDKHKTRELARQFVEYLTQSDAQRAYAKHGLRPVAPEIASEFASQFPAPADLFTIRDLGDWAGVQERIFAPGASYDQALSASSQNAGEL